MSEPIKVVAFCGSLRKASFNRMALHAFIERLPAGTSVADHRNGDWPLYNADIQAQGFPDKVQAAQKAMIEADGLVLVTPEYNYSAFRRAEERHRLAVAHDSAALRRQADRHVRRLGGHSRHGARAISAAPDHGVPRRPAGEQAGGDDRRRRPTFVDGKLTDEATGKLLAELGASLVLAVRHARAIKEHVK